MRDPTSPWRPRRSWWSAVPLWCAVYLAAIACATFVPQQGWNPDFGPVVPHDSFPADCSLCHTGGDWHTLRADFAFDHARETGVPLLGAHAGAGCLLCHNDRGPVAQFAAQGCGGCHPDPHLGRLGRNCADCHEERSWYPREVITLHDRTRFPLVGAHAAAACFRCHPGAQVGNFAGASSVCVHCHQADFARTANPNHAVVGFSTDCETCHLPVGWQPARFAHPASFPLTNAHAGRLCAECHTTPNSFTGLSADCVTCHNDDFIAASEPNHGAAGFSTDCAQCHDTRTFRRASWPHPGAFPLTFAHAGRRCTECHVGQVYSGTSGDCSSCHLDDYQATRNPNHAAAGFGLDCRQCHNTMGWRGASGHPTSFPLENAHQRACTACHQGGVYTGLNPACASCHLAAYNATTNPPHVAFQMGLNCEQCHGTVRWGQGSWTHRFPIQGGPHGNRACFDCHNNPANRLQFSCIDCHEHRQSEMANKHDEVSGYVWASPNCYACHPNGTH
ncbi:MAG: hypothetical protein KF830_18760 [Planctomycetes bacterium]|nr:hypothetical protein [Planctomycetota bacterium]